MNAPATPNPQHIAYISLGSNIAPEDNLPRAVALLRERSELQALSSAWRSPAVGSQGPDFINAAACLRTELDFQGLKALLREIEAVLGRVRGPNPNAPRPIDLDILFFDQDLIDTDVWRYPHLALPLSELLPELRNEEGETLAARARQLGADTQIAVVEELIK